MKDIKKILIAKDGHVFYVKDLEQDFHNQFGLIMAKDLQKKDGSIVASNKGEEFVLTTPKFIDMYHRLGRQAQLITLKDIGEIITETGLGKEDFVVDCGAGSGGLACYLAFVCKKVVSYDIRKDHLEIVDKNMKMLGLSNYQLKNIDVYEKIEETEVDVVTIDVPEPWRAADNAFKALKPGGFLISYSPSVTQSINMVNKAIEENKFCHIRTTEVVQRNWDIIDRVAHPKFRDLNHTGFISFFRKVRA